MEWKEIKGFEGLYKISSNGIVFSARSMKFLKPGFSHAGKKGYLNVNLIRDNIAVNARIHRLVAEHFISPPPDGQEVNHKNGIKTDNRVENLEWVTKQQNLVHNIELKGRSNIKLTSQMVKEFKELLRNGATVPQIAHRYPVSKNTLYKIKYNLRWSRVA